MEFDLESALAVLERTPAVLDRELRGLPEAWTAPNEGGETWSPRKVVGHLINGEETDWIPRTRIILGPGENRRFVPFDRFRRLASEDAMTLDQLLDRFAALRAANLATLRGFRLGPAELARTGIHPDFGTVTMRQLLATWVVHDLDHLVQVARVMAFQYTDAVGPWKLYLSVLTDRRKDRDAPKD